MPKFKELREAKGLLAKQVAERASVDVTMYSRFEKYRALPIPCDFERILDALECLPTDIYTPRRGAASTERNESRSDRRGKSRPKADRIQNDGTAQQRLPQGIDARDIAKMRV